MTTTHALNSGAINTVPFPGSEAGSTLIELIGTVEVAASITNIRVLLTTGARTTPNAACIASTRARINLQATTPASAVAQDIAYRVLVPAIGATLASASGSAATIIKHLFGSSTVAGAIGAATSYQKASKGAATTAQAATSQPVAIKYVNRSAAAVATAYCNNIVEKLKALNAGSVVAAANAVAGVSFRSRVGAQGAAVATAQASPIQYAYRGAAALSSAPASAGVILSYRMQPTPATARAVGASGIFLFAATQGGTNASALGSASIILGRKTGASVTATAIAYAAGADFAIKLPAPIERQIVVPFYDRTMKVVA